MRRYNFIVQIFALLLCLSFANDLAFADAQPSSETAAFVIPTNDYVESGSSSEVSYMPAVHSQLALPICCAMAAVTLYMQHDCKIEDTSDCASTPLDRVPSALSLAALANSKNGPSLRKDNPISLDKGAGLEFLLLKARDSGLILPESCFPYDQFSARYAQGTINDKVQASRGAFDELRKLYVEQRQKHDVNTCSIIESKFGIFSDVKNVNDALNESSFESFLHHLLLGNCDTGLEFTVSSHVVWPRKMSTTPVTYDDAFIKIKQVLNQNTPIGISLCPNEIPQTNDVGNCKTGSHCAVISGYKKVCKESSCIDLVKIHNSWGADWQAENNDGWVLAKPLLEHAAIGKASQLLYLDGE